MQMFFTCAGQLCLSFWSVLINFGVFYFVFLSVLFCFFGLLIMIQLMYWEMWKAGFKSEMVVIIAKAHLAQRKRKIVQYIGTSVPRPQLA